MDSDKKHISYSAEDIQQYLSGKLGPAEMHAIEKAALDDPFLAEAMEGYEGMQEKDWDKQLSVIKNNFLIAQTAKVVQLNPVRRYFAWKVAAAVLIIFSSVAITYNLLKEDTTENKSIAAVKTIPDTTNATEAGTVIEDTIAIAAAPIERRIENKNANQPLGVKEDNKSIAGNEMVLRPESSENKQIDATASAGYEKSKINPVSEVSTINQAPVIAKNDFDKFEKAERKSAHPEMEKATEIKRIAAIPNRRFSAQVVGPDGSPLPFANVTVPNENFGTYADAKGNFRLVSPDSLLNVDVKSAGYIPQNITLRSDLYQNKIILSDDNLALREKTLIAGNTTPFAKRGRAALVPDTIINVEPADGWNNYDTYINNNLAIPDIVLQKQIHGEVELSFEVRSDGVISNMKIDKSLCDDCDEAALKVIKEGPRWKIKKGNKGIAKVKVKF